jgi:hypothetical protein
MKSTIQLWTLSELLDEVFRQEKTGEDIYLIAYSPRFRNSHFSILRALIEVINKQKK